MPAAMPKLIITLTYETPVSRSRIDANSIKAVLRRAVKTERCPADVAAAIIFIGDAKMRAMNKQYRGKDKTTNVLAFPNAPSPRSSSAGRGGHSIPLPLGEGRVRVDLGDVFISFPEARRESKKYGWTLKYEIARLALHGFLHLLGYDHVRDNEAKVMEGIEENILKYVEH